MRYSQHFSQARTPQSQPIPGRDMAQNEAGGYAFTLDKWKRLDRFLILGTESGSYYVGERDLTVQNANGVLNCINEDGKRVVTQAVDVSKNGRAYKNNAAQFVLAMVMTFGEKDTREAAYRALPEICRIPTHLFGLLNDLKELKPNMWSAGLRRAVSRWYNDKPIDKLAYQMVKYRQRDGWTHRDVLRLAHPKPPDPRYNALYGWAIRGDKSKEEYDEPGLLDGQDLIGAYEVARVAESEKEIASLVTDSGLPWEALDTKWLASPAVWEALLPKLPITALIRNLARMTRSGLLAPMSKAAQFAVDQVTDQELLKKGRIHPLQVLAALVTYAGGESAFTGRSDVGRHMGHHDDVQVRTWEPVSQIIDALNDAFYLTFDNLEPTGKRFLLAIDTSGSMTWDPVSGIPNLYPRTAAAAMAMVVANTEQKYHVVSYATKPRAMSISPKQRLNDVLDIIDGLETGGTDCAAPMLYALYHKIEIDTFVNLTDNQTWQGSTHPMQALQEYRREINPEAKLIVVGMTGEAFSVADPNDEGSLDVVGCDTGTPRLIADFAAGRI